MSVKRGKAVICLSSGLDSSVALALALEAGWEIILALTYDYGQRARKKEIQSARKICAHYEIEHQTIDLPWFKSFQKPSALLNADKKLPHPKVSELSSQIHSERSAKAVWIPNRNGVFIEIAAGFAEDRGASAVLVGFNREEAASFPDNSLAYMDAVTRGLHFSTSTHVCVISPTATMDKVQIVSEAQRLDFPFKLLWSCYESHDEMCGLCESCMRLKRALSNHRLLNEVRFEHASV